jgi:hypothetical protein
VLICGEPVVPCHSLVQLVLSVSRPQRTPASFLPSLLPALSRPGRYFISNYRKDILIAIAIGFIFRLIALLMMATMDREKKL